MIRNEMDKEYLSPLDLLQIATEHAYSADNLLQQLTPQSPNSADSFLIPITSLLYQAFRLTLKAYALHEGKNIKDHKTLAELVELNAHLGLSRQEVGLLKQLSRQQAFHRGIDYHLWDDHQQLQLFCEDMLCLYQRLHALMPLELHPDYLN